MPGAVNHLMGCHMPECLKRPEDAPRRQEDLIRRGAVKGPLLRRLMNGALTAFDQRINDLLRSLSCLRVIQRRISVKSRKAFHLLGIETVK